MHSYYIVGCQGTESIVQNLSQQVLISHCMTQTGEFPNEELKLRVPEYGETTFLVGSLSHPVNNRIMEFLLAADAIKRMGSRNIIGILTWYPYSKQDKVFLPGEPLSAKVMASLLQTTSIRELYTLDLHNPSIAGYFEIPVYNCSATEVFINKLKQESLENTILVSPDAGSIKNSTKIAHQLGLPIAYVNKSRDLTTGEVSIRDISTPVDGKNILIFDDMIATGSTLIEVAEYLKNHGAGAITICCTHHLYLKGVQDKLDAAPIDRLIVTNSITPSSINHSDKLEIVDISTLFAEELQSRIIHR